MKIKRIMVTGATGYIGSNIISQILKDQKHIHIIAEVRNKNQANKLKKYLQSDSRLTYEYGELPNKIWNMDNIDTIIHCAGLLIQTDQSNIFQVNTDGTREMLNIAKNSNIKRFIYLSSQSIYGTNGPAKLNEDTSAQPESLYAVSKLAAEMICLEKEFKDLQTIILRIPRIYGKGLFMRDELLPHFYAKMAAMGNSLPIYIYNPESVNYLHIEDLINAIIKTTCIDDLPNKLILNISNSIAISNLELAATCQDITSDLYLKKPSLELIKKYALPSIASIMDNKKAKQYLDWSPSITIKEGMTSLIKQEISL